MQGGSEQCMQATEIERSPGLPSFNVTTRRRLTPHGTSCSFLQAVTQALHSMQRSASHRNFIRAMVRSLSSSFPRKRESRTPMIERLPWTPACAGVTIGFVECLSFDLDNYAFSMRQRVVLVSCICVTAS